jgi:hypothetical protein
MVTELGTGQSFSLQVQGHRPIGGALRGRLMSAVLGHSKRLAEWLVSSDIAGR